MAENVIRIDSYQPGIRVINNRNDKDVAGKLRSNCLLFLKGFGGRLFDCFVFKRTVAFNVLPY